MWVVYASLIDCIPRDKIAKPPRRQRASTLQITKNGFSGSATCELYTWNLIIDQNKTFRDFLNKKKYVMSYSESVQCNFSFLITWRSSSSKSVAVYKISWKSDDFSLRYGDISIFKMAAVRHLGIVLPAYETIHEICCWPQLPVKFHVNLIHRSVYLKIL